jgi:hypothetical protein
LATDRVAAFAGAGRSFDTLTRLLRGSWRIVLKSVALELLLGVLVGALLGSAVASAVWAVSYLVARNLVDSGFLSDVFLSLLAYMAAAGALTYVVIVCVPRWCRRRAS